MITLIMKSVFKAELRITVASNFSHGRCLRVVDRQDRSVDIEFKSLRHAIVEREVCRVLSPGRIKLALKDVLLVEELEVKLPLVRRVRIVSIKWELGASSGAWE